MSVSILCVYNRETTSRTSANGHCTVSQDGDRRANWTTVYTNQPKNNRMSKLCSSILTFVSHYPVLPNVNFLLEGTFSLEKWKSKWLTIRNMCFQKLQKILFKKKKTLLVMYYRYDTCKTFWYQFCKFKHFLKAEKNEDRLASSCEEFCINIFCNPVWDWVTIGTTNVIQNQNQSH